MGLTPIKTMDKAKSIYKVSSHKTLKQKKHEVIEILCTFESANKINITRVILQHHCCCFLGIERQTHLLPEPSRIALKGCQRMTAEKETCTFDVIKQITAEKIVG